MKNKGDVAERAPNFGPIQGQLSCYRYRDRDEVASARWANMYENTQVGLESFFLKKVQFTALNYRLSLYFHLELENQIFCLLKLAKPEIRPL